jgi:hypothetical protein
VAAASIMAAIACPRVSGRPVLQSRFVTGRLDDHDLSGGLDVSAGRPPG